jgi:YHS domain-containing protein
MGGLLRLLLLVVALWLIISVGRRLFLPPPSFPPRKKEGGKGQEGVPLVQDLQCGRFVPERDAVSTSFHGQRLHFCSQECRDLYIRSQVTGG